MDTENEIENMSVKQLKEFIQSNGGSLAGCVEKSDLKKKAKEVAQSLNSKKDDVTTSDDSATAAAATAASDTSAKPQSKPKLTKKTQKIGKLECTCIGDADGLDGADMVIIMLHGYGAMGSQFEFLQQSWNSSYGDDSTKLYWIFPQAPSQGWWPIDLGQWQMAFAEGQEVIAKMLRETPKGLDEARSQVLSVINQVETKVKPERIIIGGFSQGSMLTIEVALSMEKACAGMIVLSSFPVNIEDWAKKCKDKKGLKVIQVHGKNDPLLPFVASGWLRDLLKTNGLDVEYIAHQGYHDIGDAAVLKRVLEFIHSRCHSE